MELPDPKLYQRLKDFDVSREQFGDCVAQSSLLLGITEEEVIQKLEQSLSQEQRKCIQRSAAHNMKLEWYQEKAVKHMLTHRGLIVAFDVGTGKTLAAVTIANCILLVADFVQKDIQVIVITPTSLQENFKKEMRAVGLDSDDPRYRFFTLQGFANAYKKGDIDCKRSLLIVDEAHNLRTDYRLEFQETRYGRGKEGTRAEIVLKCAAKAWKVLLLTATPVYDYDYHIVNLVSMVLGKYPPLSEFDFNQILGNEEKFRETLGCVFAFYNSDKTQYPDRRDEYIEIPMTNKYYQEYLIEQKRVRQKMGKGKKKRKSNVNAFMVRTRTATIHLKPNLKIQEAMRLIKEGEKTLVYSEFLDTSDLLKKRLDEAGITYLQISGRTTKKKRAEIVNAFNKPEEPNVLIISKAGGEGLDLKGVRKVILMEKGWTVAGEHQVTGRAIRRKSHFHLPEGLQNVTVYHLVISLPEKVYLEHAGYPRVEFYEDPIMNKAMRVVGIPLTLAVLSNKLFKAALSADEYLHVRSRVKAMNAMELKERLESVDIFHSECPSEPKYERYHSPADFYIVRDDPRPRRILPAWMTS